MNCGSNDQEVCRYAIDEGTPPSIAVIECVSEVDGDDPANQPPLHEAIDPEALNDLFRDRSGGEVTFTYLDYEITVTSNSVTTTRRRADPPVSAD